MKIEVSSDFKKISLIEPDDASTYKVVESYLNGTLTYTQADNGSATINGTTYTTTSGANDLNFASTTTTIGTEFIHTISSSNLGESSERLFDGVWAFKILSSDGTIQNIGGIVHYEIDCCIANNLDSVCSGNCFIEDVLQKGAEIRALLYSAKVSAKLGEFSNALCKFEIIKKLCEKCSSKMK